MKITQVPQTFDVTVNDDFYVKTGNEFRRVPIDRLLALAESREATILNMTLTGSIVTLNMTPSALIELCGGQKKVYFMLGSIAFTVSGIDVSNNRVNLAATLGGVSYEVTLSQASTTTMGGTLVSTNLVNIPVPTAADNGKFLLVDNGAYVLETIPAAESEAF